MGSGVSFHGEEGTLELKDNSYKIYNNKGELVKRADPTSNTTVSQSGAGFDLDKDHFANFLDSLETGKGLNSPYADSYKSVLLGHLGNISYRVGRSLVCDPQNGHVKNDAAASALWSRQYEKGWEPTI